MSTELASHQMKTWHDGWRSSVLLYIVAPISVVSCSSVPSSTGSESASKSGVGKEAEGFLGIFTHTVHKLPHGEQVESLKALLDGNPHIKGATVRLSWQELEPEEGRFNWDGADKMIAFLESRNMTMALELFAGWFSPEWIYARGVQPFEIPDPNPERPTYGKLMKGPLPWDETYQKYWKRLVIKVAERYGHEPLLHDVAVHGHNHRLEMHMGRTPELMEKWRKAGWSPELVEQDWKQWIDFFVARFPRPRINIILSRMYDSSTDVVVERLADYAVAKYPGRILLSTHGLQGQRDQYNALHFRIALKHPEVPLAHELVGTMENQTEHVAVAQGSLEMTVYNMRLRPPIYIRLWNKESSKSDICARILAEYQRASDMTLDAYRQLLVSKGLFREAVAQSLADEPPRAPVREKAEQQSR